MPQDSTKVSKVDVVAKKLATQVNSQIKTSTPLQFIKTGVSTSSYSEQDRLAERGRLNSSTSKKPKTDSSK